MDGTYLHGHESLHIRFLSLHPVVSHAPKWRIVSLFYFACQFSGSKAKFYGRTQVFVGTGVVELYPVIPFTKYFNVPGNFISGVCPFCEERTIWPSVRSLDV